jgi:hypothetical protein
MTYTITGFEFGLLRLSGLLVPLAIAPWAVALIGVPAGWWEPEGRWAVYLICTALAVLGARRWTLAVRECFVREAALPQLLKHRLRDAYPLLSAKDADLAERGLRQFFIACLRSNKNFVAVPSHAVGALWSAFSQDSKAYRNWCQNALGYAPDYSPAQVLGKKASNNDALRRAWYWACKDEAIDPRKPSRLPCCCAGHNWPFRRLYYAPAAEQRPAGPRPTAHCHNALAPVFRTAYSGRFQDFGGSERSGGKTSHKHGDDGGEGDSSDAEENGDN